MARPATWLCLHGRLGALALGTVLLTSAPARALDLGGFTKGLLENADAIGNVLSNPGALTGSFSEDQERRLGQAAAAVLLGAAPLNQDAEAQRYLNTVGMWLARHTERPQLAWRFAILDTASINAFAAPGGYVFLTRGLFRILRSESELAGVLAHEMGHVLARHHLVAMTSRERFKLVADLALKATDTRGLLSDTLVGLTREMYAKGLEQDDEFQADAMGVIIAARAGYDPYGLTQVLRTIDGAGADVATTGFFLSTHPAGAARLERLAAILERGFDVPPHPNLEPFRAMQARLRRR